MAEDGRTVGGASEHARTHARTRTLGAPFRYEGSGRRGWVARGRRRTDEVETKGNKGNRNVSLRQSQ